MTRGDLWLCALTLGVALAACETNHAALEKKPNVGAGGVGGDSGGGGSFNRIGGSGGKVASGGGHSDDEPKGQSVLTIVNGVVDAPRVALCWATVSADQGVVPFGDPLSDTPLDYGQSLVLHDVAGADLAADTLQLFVIAGDLELISGLACPDAIERARSEESANAASAPDAAQGGAAGDSAQAAFAGANASTDGGASSAAEETSAAGEAGAAGATGAFPSAGRSRLRVRGLPAIAAGTLNAGRSLVLAANGCMAGHAFNGRRAEQYCGAGYSETDPTLSASLVNLSRKLSFDHAGMQVVNASLANAQVDVSSRPSVPAGAAGIPIVSALVEGQVAPRPALLSNTAFDYGSTRLYNLEVSTQDGALFSEGWQDVLARGGIKELLNETTYALVLSGPRCGLKAVPELWNAPALTAIEADPAP